MMQVFKIEPLSQTKEEGVKETPSTKAPDINQATTEDQQTEQTTETTTDETFVLQESKTNIKGKDQYIAVKTTGALGQIFTDVLNEVLAAEGMAAMMVEVDASKIPSDDLLYVDLYDPSELTRELTFDIYNDVTCRNTDTIMGIESVANKPSFTRYYGYYEDLGKLPRVTTKYSLRSLVSEVARRVKP